MNILLGILKFWDQVTWFVKLFQETDEQHHEKLLAKMKEEAENYAKNDGRPKW